MNLASDVLVFLSLFDFAKLAHKDLYVRSKEASSPGPSPILQLRAWQAEQGLHFSSSLYRWPGACAQRNLPTITGSLVF